MIQITAETMDSLRQALRDMKDFTITCGKAEQEENPELVHILWTEDDQNFNKGWGEERKGILVIWIIKIHSFYYKNSNNNYIQVIKVIGFTEVLLKQQTNLNTWVGL